MDKGEMGALLTFFCICSCAVQPGIAPILVAVIIIAFCVDEDTGCMGKIVHAMVVLASGMLVIGGILMMDPIACIASVIVFCAAALLHKYI